MCTHLFRHAHRVQEAAVPRQSHLRHINQQCSGAVTQAVRTQPLGGCILTWVALDECRQPSQPLQSTPSRQRANQECGVPLSSAELAKLNQSI